MEVKNNLKNKPIRHLINSLLKVNLKKMENKLTKHKKDLKTL
jgi:hypothetical protein